jgi:multiple sugar transport system permease protein
VQPAAEVTHRPYTPWLFLLPGLAVCIMFTIFPFLNMIVLSFTDASALGGGRFTGVDNFVRMAQDPKFWVAARNSLLYMAGVVPPLVVLPLLIAMLAQKAVPGIGIFRTAFFTPVIASAVVVGLIWTWLLDSRGLVNNVVEALGGTRIGFLTDSTLLLISSMIVTIWRGLGYYMVIYLAALANVPKDLHEAAMVDGAGPIRRFWSVTVPALRPTMVLVAALSAVNGFRVFSEIYLLSGGTGGPGGASTTMVLLIQSVGRGLTGEVGYASALSLVLFVILLGLLLITLKLNRREDQL